MVILLKTWADALAGIVHDDGIQMSLIIIVLKKNTTTSVSAAKQCVLP
jgi:hypothetical protein